MRQPKSASSLSNCWCILMTKSPSTCPMMRHLMVSERFYHTGFQMAQTDRPIRYMSRSLSSAEGGYSQLKKEALVIILSLKKFHQYLFGKHCTIVMDHKPLLGLLGENKGIPQLAAARMQRWSLIFAAYEYKEGSKHGNADALSRLPLPTTPITTPREGGW